MAKVEINKQTFDAGEDKNILETCLTLGFDLPYFCWHPAMGSVGACRQCAVKQFKNHEDKHGKIVMACMTPVKEGTIISLDDPEATAFRASVIEWLMVNHPHDCPVCDEGGECHLQDMTVMTGHTYRRYKFKKRTFENQNLGPFVNHEMNRCIACYRCVRFYRDYAGGRDFNVFATHDHVYFGRQEPGVLESEFSGNLVEVCPTGVFTDKTLKKHFTRKWDLQTAPSVCVHCSLGCNTIPGERYGQLRRIRNRFHHDINGYFLCDRGRYGYEFVNSERRLRDIWFRETQRSSHKTITTKEALPIISSYLAESLKGRIIGIGSPRASIEANFALRKLVGADNFFTGCSDAELAPLQKALTVLRSGAVTSASIRDVETSDATFILGEDVANTAPRLALALRQSVRNEPLQESRRLQIPDWQDAAVREVIQGAKGPLFIASAMATKIDELAALTYRAAPQEIARLGFAVAHELDDSLPLVPELSNEVKNVAKKIAQGLLAAQKPVIISGTGLSSEAIIEAAANVAQALHRRNQNTRICFTALEPNSFGVAFLGGKPISEAQKAAEKDEVDSILVLENDLYRRMTVSNADSLLSHSKHVVLIDHTATAMLHHSDLILPAATFAESEGTFINNEGRAQRSYKVFEPNFEKPSAILESWQWIREALIDQRLVTKDQWKDIGELRTDLAREIPILAAAVYAAPAGGFRVQGEKIPRQVHRYSGRTSMHANVTIHEPKPPSDPDSPLSYSMEGFDGIPPAPLVTHYWAPGWNSVQALNKFQNEVAGELHGGPSGARIIEPKHQVSPFTRVPDAFSPRDGWWLAFPVYHVFGSDELSSLSPGVAELSPRPFALMNRDDGLELQLNENDRIIVSKVGGVKVTLPVRLLETIPKGMIGIPRGLPTLAGKEIGLSDLVRVMKELPGNIGPYPQTLSQAESPQQTEVGRE